MTPTALPHTAIGAAIGVLIPSPDVLADVLAGPPAHAALVLPSTDIALPHAVTGALTGA